MNLFSIFVVGLIYSINVNSYSLSFMSSLETYPGNYSHFSSYVTVNNNKRIHKNISKFSVSFSHYLKRDMAFDITINRKLERMSFSEGETQEGSFSLFYTPKIFNLRSNIEGTRMRKDSSIHTLGYGVEIYKLFSFKKVDAFLDVNLQKFGMFHRKTVRIETEYDAKGKKVKAGIIYSGFDIPFRLEQTDKRLLKKGYINIKGAFSWISSILFVNIREEKSLHVWNLNYHDISLGGKLRLLWSGTADYGFYSAADLQRELKTYRKGNKESVLLYGIKGNTYWHFVFVRAEAKMRRYDFQRLMPMDRDERQIIFGCGIKPFKLEYSRTDVNYIKREYRNNSTKEENYSIRIKKTLGTFGSSEVYFEGQLFAGNSLPVYSNTRGLYQRFWKNNFGVESKDTSHLLKLTVRYKQFGEFSGDSIYNPVASVEISSDGYVRLVKNEDFSIYTGESFSAIVGKECREWHLTFRINTYRYSLYFGIGELLGRGDSFIEFKSWI